VSLQTEKFIVIGRLGAPYGVKGWIKLQSFTDPVDNILEYQPWLATLNGKNTSIEVINHRKHNKGIVVQLEGCTNRDDTLYYRNSDIIVNRDVLPALDAGEFYWADLEGIEVFTLEGNRLGTIDHLFPTGANDVIVVKDKGKSECLIPYLMDKVIKEIDLDNNKMIVDWDTDF
jgi:16S rRNA processing protein RimM